MPMLSTELAVRSEQCKMAVDPFSLPHFCFLQKCSHLSGTGSTVVCGKDRPQPTEREREGPT